MTGYFQTRATAIELYQGGIPMTQIAKLLGCSRGKIHNILIREGIERRRCGRTMRDVDTKDIIDLYKSGFTFKQIAEKFNCSISMVRSRYVKFLAEEMKMRKENENTKNKTN